MSTPLTVEDIYPGMETCACAKCSTHTNPKDLYPTSDGGFQCKTCIQPGEGFFDRAAYDAWADTCSNTYDEEDLKELKQYDDLCSHIESEFKTLPDGLAMQVLGFTVGLIAKKVPVYDTGGEGSIRRGYEELLAETVRVSWANGLIEKRKEKEGQT
jgi:hypothetical protein